MYFVLFVFIEWLMYILDKFIDRNVICYINFEKYLYIFIYICY